MKMRIFWWVVPAALLLGSCKKKEEAKTPAAPPAVEQSADTSVPEEPPAPKVPALSPEERAAKLGFARHLPQDTGVMMSFHNGNRISGSVKSSNFWKLVREEMGAPADDSQQPADAANELTGPAALFGKEFTIAVGPQVGEQTANLLKLNSRSTHIQMRILAQAWAEAAKSGELSAGFSESMAQRFSSDMLVELLDDPESGVALLEKMRMPALYLAFRTTEENRAAAAQQLASITEFLSFLGETVEPVEVQRAGQTFAGQKISGTKVSEAMANEREAMEADLDPATVDRILAAIDKKDLVVMSGTIGDYAVLFIGSSVDDLVFAEDIGSSLVTGEGLAFCDAYAEKDLAAVFYGQKESLVRMLANSGGLADMTDGLREGLAGTEGIGDTRDLEALLRMVGEREAALRALWKTEATGTVAFLEDGMKIECYGGIDSGAIDWQAVNRLAPLGESPDVAFFLSMTSQEAYDEAASSYFEALMETAYALAMKAAEFPMKNEEMARFKEMAGIFDEKFRPDVVALWETLRGDLSSGLTAEGALVVDLKGTPPPVPGLAQEIVDQGKFPRITYIAPVDDRAKLAEAWQKMNSSTTQLLGKISEVTGTQIPMQKPISSERDGFTTWFFSMPFFNDEFMPSITVGDAWFAASTSKNQALDLLGSAEKSTDGMRGLNMTVNFGPLREFAMQSLDLLEKHPETVTLETEDLTKMRSLADSLKDFDKLTLHSRKEGGTVRTSIHLKTSN